TSAMQRRTRHAVVSTCSACAQLTDRLASRVRFREPHLIVIEPRRFDRCRPAAEAIAGRAHEDAWDGVAVDRFTILVASDDLGEHLLLGPFQVLVARVVGWIRDAGELAGAHDTAEVQLDRAAQILAARRRE